MPRPELTITRLILLTALCFTVFYNVAFFRNSYFVYGANPGGIAFLASLGVFLFAATVLLLSALCVRYLTKPVLIVVVLGAAAANCFMYRYNIVIDTNMLSNVAATDRKEVYDLLTPALLLQLVLLGLLPALLIWRARIRCEGLREMWNRLKLMAVGVVLLVASLIPFSAYYTSFFREHKLLRYYANPATFIYSSGRFLHDSVALRDTGPRSALGLDAHIPAADTSRELVILVVGEAARADHLALNGYARDTNPLLSREPVISFAHITSCGTATAYSLPCMFSSAPRGDFEPDRAGLSENLLDVLRHAGVNVLWRDNNSDSKGVATGVEFQDFRSSATNPVCDIECRDVGMLEGLDQYIAAHPDGDIVIVLHQMGNHGPAYYRRYPAAFEVFTPACHSNELGNCSDEEIANAYDNALRYTDYFLAEVIHFLRGYDDRFETAMYYMSDHGESLGENGLYLHGLPWMLAPEAQKHVASILWFGKQYRVDRTRVLQAAGRPWSHDNYFHTVLALLEIETAEYRDALSLVAH